MYFPFFKLRQRSKRSATHPQTIYSEVPYRKVYSFAETFLFKSMNFGMLGRLMTLQMRL